MSDMDAYRDIFLSESAEFMQGITDGLLALESEPADLAPVEIIFRGAHSLKGMAAAMGYDRTADLTHKMESLMSRVRERERVVDRPLIDVMLEAVDTVRALIDDESSGANALDASALVAQLEALESAPKTDSDTSAGTDAGEIGEPVLDEQRAEGLVPSERDVAGIDARARSGETLFRVAVTLDENCVLKAVRAYMVIKRLSHMGHVVDTIPPGREIEDEQFDREFTVLLSTASDARAIQDAVLGVSEVDACTAEIAEETGSARSNTEVTTIESDTDSEAEAEAEAAARRRTAIPKLSETQTVRIAIGHLDTLVNLVGELVILRSRLERVAGRIDDHELNDAIEQLHQVSADLQHEVMHTRMVPVGNIFNRFPRMVRDLARDLDKDVAFEMEGLDIELDRTVLDEIGDPIVHLLRNSIDHGIESAADREAAGKPPRGTVRLAASRERDRVRISVSDDGRGIESDRVWDKACSLGLADPGSRGTYSDADVLLFTCVPGFSTATQATKVSGRGVGMDVVKGKIEHLGGALSIVSRPGSGTEFVLTLPLTLAIIQALILSSGGETYALPLSVVDEVLGGSDMEYDTIDGMPVAVDREGSIIPVHHLGALLGYSTDHKRMPSAQEHVVLVESAGQRKALVVESLLGRREIVIKPLSRMLRGARGVGGATVLGDGRVALIIDQRTLFPSREEN